MWRMSRSHQASTLHIISATYRLHMIVNDSDMYYLIYLYQPSNNYKNNFMHSPPGEAHPQTHEIWVPDQNRNARQAVQNQCQIQGPLERLAGEKKPTG